MFARHFSREDLQTEGGIGGLVRTILDLSGLNSVVSGQRGGMGGMLMSGPNDGNKCAWHAPWTALTRPSQTTLQFLAVEGKAFGDVELF